MPSKKAAAFRRWWKKRRNYKAKRRNRNRRARYTTVNRGVAPISDRFITKMKYADRVTLTLFANSPYDQTYRLNSLFDPDLTLSGHQPLGFDQIATLYNRYRVYKVSYRVVLEPNNTNTGYLQVIPNGSNTSLTAQSLNYLMEMQRAITKTIKIDEPTIISGSYYLPRLNGDPASRYKSDDRFQATTTASPAEAMNLHICVTPTVNVTMNMSVTLMYHAEFFDPITPAQS